MSKFANKLIKKSGTAKKNKIQIKVKAKKKSVPSIKSKTKSVKKKFHDKELIVIDETQGLIFENEKTLFGYFDSGIHCGFPWCGRGKSLAATATSPARRA